MRLVLWGWLMGSCAVALTACGGGDSVSDAGRDAGAAQCSGAECCGNMVVDPGEDCDDGNAFAFDGCEPMTCEYTCTTDEHCDDRMRCNGSDLCNTTTHTCVPGSPADPPCMSVPGSVGSLGGARRGGAIIVREEAFERLGYGCTDAICASGRIEP